MSYLRYLCLLAYSGTQHILCCGFALFFIVFPSLCCQFLWIVHLWLSLRYSLTFIYNHVFFLLDLWRCTYLNTCTRFFISQQSDQKWFITCHVFMFQTRYVTDNGEVVSDYKRRMQSENDIYFNSRIILSIYQRHTVQ